MKRRIVVQNVGENKLLKLANLVDAIAKELSGIAISDMETAEINIVRHLYDAEIGKIEDGTYNYQNNL